MFNKTIVRHMVFGEPVIIGPKPKPVVVEPEPEAIDEPEVEVVEPEPEPKIDLELQRKLLDEISARLADIEAKTADAEAKFRQAEETLLEADKTKTQADRLQKKAHKIREEARAEADKLIADTKREAEETLAAARKEGYDDGYAEGREIGIKDGREHIEDELADIVRQANDKAQQTIRDAKEQTSEYFIRAEDDIARIVNIAIEKVLPNLFREMPQAILPAVREAVRHVRDQREIKVHVEPYSYDLILMARSEFQSMLTDGTAIIEIVSDDALKPGDCIIETPNGNVDARLSTQLELMKSAVQSVMNGGSRD
ncbi:MAG: flagellar assembly protein FliH [Quinella sp. 2Q5]|nr:flagellar assembly protein FliH [Quinella sp. 2Q5]